jgi:hypothetical protein
MNIMANIPSLVLYKGYKMYGLFGAIPNEMFIDL